MTRDVLSLDTSYPINGTGPYEYLNPYREGALLVRIERDGILVTLDVSAYTVDPVSSDVSGGIILSDAAAALYDGGDLFISRRTDVEQGWSGMSAREVLVRLTVAALSPCWSSTRMGEMLSEEPALSEAWLESGCPWAGQQARANDPHAANMASARMVLAVRVIRSSIWVRRSP